MNNTLSKLAKKNASYITPPIVPGETEADFKDFCLTWINEFKPKGIIEEDWLADSILGAWERRRLERYKVALLASAQRAAVQQIVMEYWDTDIGPDKSRDHAIDFSHRWSRRDPTARANFDVLLTKNGLDQEIVMARALTLVFNDLANCEQLIAACLRRRDAAVAQLERRHSALAERLKAASEFADDADYELVADGEVR